MVSLENAPRDINGLMQLKRGIRFRLAHQLGMFADESQEHAFMQAPDDQMCQALLQGLQTLDQQGGVQAAAVPAAPVLAPAPALTPPQTAPMPQPTQLAMPPAPGGQQVMPTIQSPVVPQQALQMPQGAPTAPQASLPAIQAPPASLPAVVPPQAPQAMQMPPVAPPAVQMPQAAPPAAPPVQMPTQQVPPVQMPPQAAMAPPQAPPQPPAPQPARQPVTDANRAAKAAAPPQTPVGGAPNMLQIQQQVAASLKQLADTSEKTQKWLEEQHLGQTQLLSTVLVIQLYMAEQAGIDAETMVKGIKMLGPEAVTSFLAALGEAEGK